MMRERTTVDLVVIVFTLMVAFSVFSATVGIIVGKIVHPEIDVSPAGEIIAGIIETVVGALIGFVGGRAVGRNEANGSK
jgi:hypothetical protein